LARILRTAIAVVIVFVQAHAFFLENAISARTPVARITPDDGSGTFTGGGVFTGGGAFPLVIGTYTR
jgi:hypothetical protein